MASTIVIQISQVSVVLLILVCTHVRVDATGDGSCNETCEYTEWALDANCRNLDLVTVPHGCDTSVSMDLRNNQLEAIGSGSFAGYGDLRYLDLEFNLIYDITAGAFSGCVSLQFIYLQFNSLESVDEGAFEGASSLERLFLNQNSIIDIHPDALHGLDKLTGLYIGHNQISQLPPRLFRNTPSLQYLHIGDNLLSNLPTGIFDVLADLTYLSLMNNNLKVIEGGLFDALQSLVELDLSGNRIISITDFPYLPRLTILDLHDNGIQQIGDLPEKVERLNELYLADNNMMCTCSLNPIREWIQDHKSDSNVDALKVNVTCDGPPRLQGQVLDSITKADLCPNVDFGLIPTLIPGKTKLTLKDEAVTRRRTNHGNAPQVQQKNEVKRSGLSNVTIYIIVGGVTLFVIIVVLCILVKCTNRQYQQHQQEEIKQEEIKQQQRCLQQITITDNSIPLQRVEDENPYEQVRPHSPMEDSAFGSQDDFSNNEEVPSWRVGQHPVGIYDPGNDSEWRGPDPLSPADGIAPLARERLSTNPFLRDMPQDEQAVPKTEDVPSLGQLSTTYVPHTVLDKMYKSDTPQYTVFEILQQNQQQGTTVHAYQWLTPEHSPQESLEHIPRHTATYELQNQGGKEKGQHHYNKKRRKIPDQNNSIYTKYIDYNSLNIELQPLQTSTDFPVTVESEMDANDYAKKKNTNPFKNLQNTNPFMM